MFTLACLISNSQSSTRFFLKAATLRTLKSTSSAIPKAKNSPFKTLIQTNDFLLNKNSDLLSLCRTFVQTFHRLDVVTIQPNNKMFKKLHKNSHSRTIVCKTFRLKKQLHRSKLTSATSKAFGQQRSVNRSRRK